MLKPLEKPPFVNGLLVTFTHQEGASFSASGTFDLALFKRRLAEKALMLVLRSRNDGEMHALLRDYTLTKAPRRFWGSNPMGYHILRLHYGYGPHERKIVLRYVRSSEDNFNGQLFNHPPRLCAD